jgi:sec-independent protein translocase protein TatA
MFNISPQELLLILVIALVVVGPQRLPELGRSIGRGIRELRRAQDDVKRTIKVNLDDDDLDTGRGPSPAADGAATNGRGATASDIHPTASEPAPSASEPLPAGEVREISRSLGRGLAELRRAREEVQRSFRVDLNEPARSAPAPAAEVSADGEGSGAGETEQDQAAG